MAYQIDIKERTFHFKQPAGTSRGIYTTRKSWMVEISDGQHTGIGECAAREHSVMRNFAIIRRCASVWRPPC